ncbi:ABC transporter permease [Rhodoplanes sp. Z2-YC6860]|uniref:ABC transporter permease n=1 Tax=Rhodoplanes sp. Z2-YC6860 TaxID=674703 RepID=UPI000836D561|nr:ABC transporter permease [Rhodoplanes sp. Z2-YC6860]
MEGARAIPAELRHESRLLTLGRISRRHPLGVFGAVVLIVIVVLAVGAPYLAPYDPVDGDTAALYSPPSSTYWLGTDAFGRDILSRLIYGARVSLLVGLGASLLGVVVGAAIGIVAGYRGGWTDAVAQRVMDAMLAFPMLLLALAMAAVLGPALHNVIIALAMPIIPRASRIARSSVLVLKATMFIEAARATGCSSTRIMLRHILPNTMAPLLIIATAYLGLAVVQEAALDYLGAGIQEPEASWGLMMSGSATSLALVAPWIVIFPGLAIFLMVLASNLLGDAIRDLLDPKLQRDFP